MSSWMVGPAPPTIRRPPAPQGQPQNKAVSKNSKPGKRLEDGRGRELERNGKEKGKEEGKQADEYERKDVLKRWRAGVQEAFTPRTRQYQENPVSLTALHLS